MQREAGAVVGEVRGGADAGRALARTLVAELAGVDAASVSIVQRCPDCGGPHGRPVVMAPPEARGVAVSLAHAGARHVAAARRGGRIGVDAELREAAPGRVEALRGLLRRDDELPCDDDLLRRWTRIEAVLKADGRGLRVEPATVVLDARDAGLVGSVPGAARAYDLHDIDLGPGLVVGLAIERD
ncbi:4'-phosphopantetheinyl transferase family protein [Agrococcus jenensis]|uniref:4'-phosphopantetheinyl transferase n=1 Tax=Agrococcus jenensis TaxID=46353 RepID=A0A3N2AUY7_9MICO|nr:4-phosphopantetheinyl transferase [Agrococcus jenensis]ROR66837.1 4'-phosphopantetheinyl transferase [Agrococcus jenensis]